MGPIWPAGLPAGWKSSFHFSRCYFSQTETQNLARDLANGVSECILDPFSRLLQTILYRTDRRRAHHLPPDPNIFNGHNRFLLNWPFSGGSKILIFPRCYFWQTESNRLFDRFLGIQKPPHGLGIAKTALSCPGSARKWRGPELSSLESSRQPM